MITLFINIIFVLYFRVSLLKKCKNEERLNIVGTFKIATLNIIKVCLWHVIKFNFCYIRNLCNIPVHYILPPCSFVVASYKLP